MRNAHGRTCASVSKDWLGSTAPLRFVEIEIQEVQIGTATVFLDPQSNAPLSFVGLQNRLPGLCRKLSKDLRRPRRGWRENDREAPIYWAPTPSRGVEIREPTYECRSAVTRKANAHRRVRGGRVLPNQRLGRI
jgi:hypothetical protein